MSGAFRLEKLLVFATVTPMLPLLLLGCAHGRPPGYPHSYEVESLPAPQTVLVPTSDDDDHAHATLNAETFGADEEWADSEDDTDNDDDTTYGVAWVPDANQVGRVGLVLRGTYRDERNGMQVASPHHHHHHSMRPTRQHHSPRSHHEP